VGGSSRNGGGKGKSGKSGRSGGMHWRRRHALEAAACIGGVGMCQKSTEADGADGASVNTRVSEAVKQSELVRTL
jgi:hypothetical protein